MVFKLKRGKIMFKIGDKVKMNDKYCVSEKNRDRVFTVTSDYRIVN